MKTKTSPLWLLIVGLVTISFLAFSPSLKAQFTNWDDPLHITNNSLIKHPSLTNLNLIFTQSINLTYIPLTTSSFVIDYFIAKDNPHIYHLFNIILHISVALVLFFLLLRMGFDRSVAFLASLIFALHPMHVESVAWLTQRKDVLYSLFYLLSLLFYQKHSLKNNFIFYLLSLGFAILSILSKPMAISLPLILILLDWYNRKKFSIRLLLEKLPFALAVGLIALITYVQNHHPPSGNLAENILLWIWCYIFYLKQFLLPFTLNPLYEISQPISLTNIDYWSSFLIFIVLIVVVFLVKNRIFKFAVLYYSLSIFFLLRFNLDFDTHIVADRFMYLPSLGFCLWFAVLARHWIIKNKISYLPITLILVFYFYKTFAMCSVWDNSTRLWTYVIQHSPSTAIAYINRANAYYLDKKYDLALRDLHKATELKPKDHAYLIDYNLGLIHLDQNNFTQAIDHFSKALQDNPFYEFVYFPRAQAWGELGNSDKALQDYNRAAKFDSYNHIIFNNRGNILRQLKEFQAAGRDFNRSLWLNPHYALGFYNRGNLYKTLKEYSLAIQDYSKSLLLNPNFLESYLNRGVCYAALKRFDLAQEDFEEVLKLDPRNSDAQRNLTILNERRIR